MPIATRAFAATAADQPLSPYSFERRDPGPDDVAIAIKYAGVCHSDLHVAKNDLGGARYPIVPGHEIAGVVTAVGANVTRFKEGDRVGVGCMVDSCRTCPSCIEGEEQYCVPGMTQTYGSPDPKGAAVGQTITQGGYSDAIVVDQNYVLRIPDSLPLDAAAPLLCAGITTWSPLKEWKVGPGSTVAVVGLGGLGHMAVKFGVAFGAEVTVLSTSPGKEEAAKALGAHHFVVTTDEAQVKAVQGSFDFILDTVSAPHDVNQYLGLLKTDGTHIIVGLPTEPIQLPAFAVVMGRKSVAGSSIGGIAETQEMLDFCAEHNIVSDIELINIQDITTAYERMVKGDVRYRFVIDIATI